MDEWERQTLVKGVDRLGVLVHRLPQLLQVALFCVLAGVVQKLLLARHPLCVREKENEREKETKKGVAPKTQTKKKGKKGNAKKKLKEKKQTSTHTGTHLNAL